MFKKVKKVIKSFLWELSYVINYRNRNYDYGDEVRLFVVDYKQFGIKWHICNWQTLLRFADYKFKILYSISLDDAVEKVNKHLGVYHYSKHDIACAVSAYLAGEDIGVHAYNIVIALGLNK